MANPFALLRSLIVLDYWEATGRSVTANIPALGAGDSGFESRRPERVLLILILVRDGGVEPPTPVWKTGILPLN